MEARRTARALLASIVLAALASQAFVGVVESRTSPMEKASQGTRLLELSSSAAKVARYACRGGSVPAGRRA
jgi:hypothetical protein